MKAVLRPAQRGQAAIEYLVVGAGLVMALFVVEVNGRTGAQYLAEAVRVFFQNLTYYLSLP